VVIISDARRPSDVEFFQQGALAGRWALLTVRIEASDVVRAQRGWLFTAGVDDAESECGLDGREWDVEVDNDGSLAALDEYGLDPFFSAMCAMSAMCASSQVSQVSAGAALALRWRCAGAALVLRCAGAALVLRWCCAGAALVLRWCCAGAALVLRCAALCPARSTLH
jgi:hypothetical protein